MGDIRTRGERLQETRKERHLTQKQLAQAIGVSPSLISDLENGAERKVSSDTIAAICDYLQVSTDWLQCRADNPTTNPELQNVIAYTGLSEKSLKVLRDLEPQYRHIIELLLDRGYGRAALISIHNFFQNHMGKNDFIYHTATNGQKIMLYGSDVENAQLQSIIGFIKDMKEKEDAKNGNT